MVSFTIAYTHFAIPFITADRDVEVIPTSIALPNFNTLRGDGLHNISLPITLRLDGVALEDNETFSIIFPGNELGPGATLHTLSGTVIDANGRKYIRTRSDLPFF